MLRSQKRLLLLLAALPLLILAGAFLYMVGMQHLEGEPRGFWQSLGFAAETLSTTGYGADHTWRHPGMVIFVVVLQFLGVFLIFLVFPIYLIPVLEERFEARLPKRAPEVPGSVVIYRWGAAVSNLAEELEKAGVPTLVVECDDAEARRLVDRGQPVVYGSLDEGVLGRAGLEGARALIANGSDDENASVLLAARQLDFQGDILAVVEEPNHRRPMMLAGATAVYTPRHILGAALAARASERISPRVEGAQALGRKLTVGEVKIGRSSELAGKTIGEARIGRRTGVTVIGQWVEGKLVAQPTASMRLAPDGILIVAGSAESVQRFSETCAGTMPLRRTGPFVLAGYGEVGQKVDQLLRDAGEEVQVIDKRPADGVDVVGDVLDIRTLEATAVRAARAVVLAVDNDSATLFATVILKDFAPGVPVIARVNHAPNVERIHRAGADFALSISQVSGQILAGRLLGQESISLDPELRVLRVNAEGLEGGHPVELAIRERTGASVVGVERGDDLILDFDPDFRFGDGDAVYICGSSGATREFVRIFPQGQG